MEQLKTMKQCLTAQVQSQMGNLQNVDAQELGEAIDMIKDLSEAIYYCTITEAMEKRYPEENGNTINYYTEKIIPTEYCPPYDDYYRDMDRVYGRMYYNGGGSRGGSSNGNSSNGGGMGSNSSGSNARSYTEREYPMSGMRDEREGRSPQKRKSYLESKQTHQDKTVQMKELENYMQELSSDLTDMIKDATPEEKQLLQRKIAALATKIT